MSARGIRIAELVRRTGTPKETIHYYLREGLLRKPKKTSKNMAYYDESHVEQLELIKRLRAESYLPLSVIKTILREAELAASVRKADLAGDLFGLGVKTEFEPLTRAELAQQSGLVEAELDELERRQILRPLSFRGQKRFRWEDVRIASVVAEALKEAGPDGRSYVLERFEIFERHMRAMVREEAAHFFARVLSGGESTRAVELLKSGRETLARYLGIARVRRMREDLDSIFRELEQVFPNDGSDIFRLPEARRLELGIDAEIERRRTILSADPKDVLAARALMDGLILDAQHSEVLALERRLEARVLADARVQLMLAEAELERRRYEEGLARLASLRQGPADALTEAIYGSLALGRLHGRVTSAGTKNAEHSSLVVAAFMADSDMLGALSEGLTALFAAKSAAAARPLDAVRAGLVVARVEAATPSFFGLKEQARRDFEAVQARAEKLGGTRDDPGFGALDGVIFAAQQFLERLEIAPST